MPAFTITAALYTRLIVATVFNFSNSPLNHSINSFLEEVFLIACLELINGKPYKSESSIVFDTEKIKEKEIVEVEETITGEVREESIKRKLLEMVAKY